jgi:hypothetical protein
MTAAFVSTAVQTATNTNVINRSFVAGNTAFLWTLTSPGAGNPYVTGIVDNQGGTWKSVIGTINVTGNTTADAGTFHMGLYYQENCPAGITTATVSFNGGNPGSIMVVAFEVSGLKTASSIIGSNQRAFTNPGTGTDAMAGTGLVVGTLPAFVIAVGGSGNGAVNSLTAGTGYTQHYKAAGNTVNYGLMVEGLRVTSSGTYTATMTDSHGASANEHVITVAFAEPSTKLCGQDGTGFSSPVSENESGGNGDSMYFNAGYLATAGTVDTAWVSIGSGGNTASNVKVVAYETGTGNKVGTSSVLPVAVGLQSVAMSFTTTAQQYYLDLVPDSGVCLVTVDNGSNAFKLKQNLPANFSYTTPPASLPAADVNNIGREFIIYLTGVPSGGGGGAGTGRQMMLGAGG